MAEHKDIFIHIGAQKTASALLRRTAMRLKPELAAAGVSLMTRAEIAAEPFHDHVHRLNTRDALRSDPVSQEVMDSLARVVKRPEPRILLMSESLFSRLPLDSFFQNISESLAFLKNHWDPHRVRLILYVRRQSSFVTSCYAQFISMGRTFSFEDFTGGAVPEHLNWHRVCSDIADVIGRENLIVRPYETIGEAGATKYVTDFFEIMGVSKGIADRVEEVTSLGAKSNRGLSQAAIEIARVGNDVLKEKERIKLRRFLQNTFSTASHPKPVFWSKEQEAELHAHYAASNSALFQEFMPDRDPSALGYV